MSNTGRNHLSVNGFKLWNFLADHWPVLRSFSVSSSIDWISNEVNVLNLWELSDFTKFVPRSDSIVADEQSVELDAWVKSFKLFNLVVRNPKLFECLTNLIESNNSFNVVSTKGKNLELLQLWQVDNSINLVGGKTKLLTHLKGIKSVVHLINVWLLANQRYFRGFGGNLSGFSFPFSDGVSAQFSWHFIFKF